jgi:hypothetical protein
VLDELPREVLEKLPLPPGLERLPEESKAKFKELHMNRNLSWRERHQLVQKAISGKKIFRTNLIYMLQSFRKINKN